MIRTVVCDDEAPALELIETMLRETGLVTVEGAYRSVHEAIARINAGGIDLAVLDVEMPELSGVHASAHITADPKPLLVFATAHPEYAVEAFGIDAIDYILKPFDGQRVLKAVEKAVRMRRLISETEGEVSRAAEAPAPPETPGMLRIGDAGRYYFIPASDVIWIEAAGDYSLLHTASREAAIRRAIKNLESELPADKFVRVHRSVIVAVTHIREIRMLQKGEAQITLTNDVSVRTSRTYRDAVQALIAGL